MKSECSPRHQANMKCVYWILWPRRISSMKLAIWFPALVQRPPSWCLEPVLPNLGMGQCVWLSDIYIYIHVYPRWMGNEYVGGTNKKLPTSSNIYQWCWCKQQGIWMFTQKNMVHDHQLVLSCPSPHYPWGQNCVQPATEPVLRSRMGLIVIKSLAHSHSHQTLWQLWMFTPSVTWNMGLDVGPHR